MELSNEVLEEYLMLSKDVREKSKRLEEIKQACKERGSFVTTDYTCLIDKTIRQGLPSLDEVTKYIQRATLETLGLIKTTPVVTVRIICREHALIETPNDKR